MAGLFSPRASTARAAALNFAVDPPIRAAVLTIFAMQAASSVAVNNKVALIVQSKVQDRARVGGQARAGIMASRLPRVRVAAGSARTTAMGEATGSVMVAAGTADRVGTTVPATVVIMAAGAAVPALVWAVVAAGLGALATFPTRVGQWLVSADLRLSLWLRRFPCSEGGRAAGVAFMQRLCQLTAVTVAGL